MKKNRNKIQNDSIILSTLKIKSPYICPNCGEKHYAYISKKRKYKGIEFGEYYHESGLFKKDYSGNWYHCHSCGYKWETCNT